MKRLTSFLCLLLAACASDPLSIPPGLSKSRAAVLRAWSPAVDAEVRVTAIDGVEIGKVSHVYLSSGEHRITARWSGGQAITRTGQVHGVFQAGSTYVIEAEPDGALRTVRFSIVDKGPEYDVQCLQQSFFGSQPKGRGC